MRKIYLLLILVYFAAQSFGQVGKNPTLADSDVKYENPPVLKSSVIQPDIKEKYAVADVNETIFNYTGAPQEYIVPPGVFQVYIEAYGAQGGTATNNISYYGCSEVGGLGGYAAGYLDVTPGESLWIYVGGKGLAGNNGGWNGGGSVPDNAGTCGKGGGASDVRKGGTTLFDRIIVAGGGGGSEYSGCDGTGGDGGGLTGADGSESWDPQRNGKGGTQTEGGAGGIGVYNGQAGSFGIGGDSGTHPEGHSAGGGGGWYGGGGSSEDGNGGGGSSYIEGLTEASTLTGVNIGDGLVSISWEISCQVIEVDNDEGECGATVEFDDPVVAGATVTRTDETGFVSGSFFPVGTTTLEYQVDYGEEVIADTCISIIVNDVDPPVIDCPGNIIVDNDPGECGASVWYGTTENFTGNFAPENWTLVTNGGNGYVDLSGAPEQITLWGSDGSPESSPDTEYKITIPNNGTMLFDWNYLTFDGDGPYYDPFGYSINGNFIQLTNSSGSSVQNGSLSIALNQGDIFAFVVKTTDDGFGRGTSAMVNFNFEGGEVSVTDNCPGAELQASHEMGSFFPVGETEVTLTATDASGNTSTCSFTVTVEDTEPPVAVCKNIVAELDESGQVTITAEDVDGGSTDNCEIDGMAIDVNAFDCSMAGENPVVLTVTDIHGNSSTCTATVFVADSIAPVAVANPIEVILDENGKYTLTQQDLEEMAVGSADNCTPSENLKLSAYPKVFYCDDVTETMHVRLTVEDEGGNIDRMWTIVTVIDAISPEAVCRDVNVYLDENGEAVITPEKINVDGDEGSYDACGIESLSLDKETFGCADAGENTVTLTVTSSSGNNATCTATVTVLDTFPPVFEPVADIEIELEAGVFETVISYPDIIVTDNCAVEPQLTEGLGPDRLFPAGTTTETWVVTDPAGNMASLSFTVTVTAVNSPPVLVNPIADQIVNASYSLKVPVSPVLGELFDDADGDELTVEVTTEDGSAMPAWANVVNDTIVFSPLIADTGCVNIVVQATDPDGATAADTFQLCVDGYPVSAPLVNAANLEVTMYPNPTKDRVTLEINSVVSGPSEVTVFTITGSQVLHRKFSDTQNISFSMKNHVSGMYFVKLNTNGKEVVKKLVLDKK